jgi:hypothetical protein
MFCARTSALLLGLFLVTALGRPCSVTGITSNIDLVSSADAVVRAKAVGYAKRPAANIWTTGVPDSRVWFKVMEVIRGLHVSEVVLPGYLVQQDDFNDRQPPYTFVRPSGRTGSCFANSYRDGAEYLLFLKKRNTGELTVNWAALAPVNEQLHSSDDAWLVWVRRKAKQLQKSSGR